MNSDELINRFKFHPATTKERQETHGETRDALLATAIWFNHSLPEGREKSLVMTHLEEAMFWANAAISRQP